jgi:hypothetical protein
MFSMAKLFRTMRSIIPKHDEGHIKFFFVLMPIISVRKIKFELEMTIFLVNLIQIMIDINFQAQHDGSKPISSLIIF